MKIFIFVYYFCHNFFLSLWYLRDLPFKIVTKLVTSFLNRIFLKTKQKKIVNGKPWQYLKFGTFEGYVLHTSGRCRRSFSSSRGRRRRSSTFTNTKSNLSKTMFRLKNNKHTKWRRCKLLTGTGFTLWHISVSTTSFGENKSVFFS